MSHTRGFRSPLRYNRLSNSCKTYVTTAFASTHPAPAAVRPSSGAGKEKPPEVDARGSAWGERKPPSWEVGGEGYPEPGDATGAAFSALTASLRACRGKPIRRRKRRYISHNGPMICGKRGYILTIGFAAAVKVGGFARTKPFVRRNGPLESWKARRKERRGVPVISDEDASGVRSY
eukprot:1180973-Prorocentrum_minimum.AAC.1